MLQWNYATCCWIHFLFKKNYFFGNTYLWKNSLTKQKFVAPHSGWTNVLIDEDFLLIWNMWFCWVFDGPFSGSVKERCSGVPGKGVTAAATGDFSNIHQYLGLCIYKSRKLLVLSFTTCITCRTYYTSDKYSKPAIDLLALVRGLGDAPQAFEKNRINQSGDGSDKATSLFCFILAGKQMICAMNGKENLCNDSICILNQLFLILTWPARVFYFYIAPCQVHSDQPVMSRPQGSTCMSSIDGTSMASTLKLWHFVDEVGVTAAFSTTLCHFLIIVDFSQQLLCNQGKSKMAINRALAMHAGVAPMTAFFNK